MFQNTVFLVKLTKFLKTLIRHWRWGSRPYRRIENNGPPLRSGPVGYVIYSKIWGFSESVGYVIYSKKSQILEVGYVIEGGGIILNTAVSGVAL